MLGRIPLWDLPFPTGINPTSVSRVVLQLFIGLALKSSKITFPQIREPGDTPPGEQNLCCLAAAEHGASIDPFHRRDGHSLGLFPPLGRGAHRCEPM